MVDWLGDNAWLVWIGIALVLAAIEVASVDFVFLMLAGGALAGAVAAGSGLAVHWQIVVAALVAALLLFAVRPYVKGRLMRGIGDPKVGVGARVGGIATVLETVTDRTGLVRFDGGSWTARCQDPSIQLMPGEDVQVVEIRGATAMVAPTVRRPASH